MSSLGFDEVKKRALAARERYQKAAVLDKVNILIYGDYGTGKTSMVCTAPKPIWICNFDPSGTTVTSIQPLIAEGSVIVVDYSNDSWKQPTQFRQWERDFAELNQSGVFEHIGTYVIDSLTRWAESALYEITKRAVGARAAGKDNEYIPDKKEYLIQQLTAVDWLSKLCHIKCNFIGTGHIGLLKDDMTGKIETGLLLAGKLSEKVPLVFEEKWLTRTQGQQEVSYVVQTKNDGYYKAETRMGGGTFAQFEHPDIKALMLKAKRETAAADRPSLF